MEGNEKNELFEYEKYELVFNHYITESSGKNVKLDEPIKCVMCTPIGEPICESAVVEKLYFEILKYLNIDISKEE